MWSMLVVLTEWEKENGSKNQCESMQHYAILQFQGMCCVCHDLILQNDVAGPSNVGCRRHNLRLIIFFYLYLSQVLFL